MHDGPAREASDILRQQVASSCCLLSSAFLDSISAAKQRGWQDSLPRDAVWLPGGFPCLLEGRLVSIDLDHDYVMRHIKGRCAEVWMHRRLPFEPSGHLLTLRRKLRDAVSTMAAGPDQLLESQYISTDEGFFDVDNVLLYNVGTGSFAKAARQGIRFLRRTETPPPVPAPSSACWPHFQRYELRSASRPFLNDAHVVAECSFRLKRLSSDLKPHDIWWAAKNGRWRTTGTPSLEHRRFGLSVKAEGPPGNKNAAALVKPLFDGIISAMHVQQGPLDEEGCRAVAEKLGVPVRNVTDGLCDDANAILGERDLLQSYRNFVKWNPGDDACGAGELRLLAGSGPDWRVHFRVLVFPTREPGSKRSEPTARPDSLPELATEAN